METFSLITLVCFATIHLMMASVLALYARYKVEYLCMTWVMGIFSALFCVAIPFYSYFKFETMGLMNPFMLLALAVTSYLQTISPLGIAMPGYLQWRRMLLYASPTILLLLFYVLHLIRGGRPSVILTYTDLFDRLLGVSMIFRVFALALSVYYVVNLVRLPRMLVKNIELPRYLKGFATVVSLNTIYYVVVSVVYDSLLFYIYLYLFTILNMYILRWKL